MGGARCRQRYFNPYGNFRSSPIPSGTVLPLDLVSISQSGKRYFSFLSQAYGIMADIDLGTEDMR